MEEEDQDLVVLEEAVLEVEDEQHQHLVSLVIVVNVEEIVSLEEAVSHQNVVVEAITTTQEMKEDHLEVTEVRHLVEMVIQTSEAIVDPHQEEVVNLVRDLIFQELKVLREDSHQIVVQDQDQIVEEIVSKVDQLMVVADLQGLKDQQRKIL